MHRILRRRPSPATVIALIALFLALGGTTYALSIPRNSVGTAQLRNSAVTQSKIRAGAVSQTRLKAQSVTNTKIANNVITAGKLALPQVKRTSVPVPPGQSVLATATCDPGRVVLQGWDSWNTPPVGTNPPGEVSNNDNLSTVFLRPVPVAAGQPIANAVQGRGYNGNSGGPAGTRVFTVIAVCLVV
jgi:hypothetical protein